MDKDAFAARVTAMQQSLYRVAASYLRGEADRLDAVDLAVPSHPSIYVFHRWRPRCVLLVEIAQPIADHR